jgi:3-isopropylmalate/(R)-2-methylmalate dehydratase large subunit
MSAADAGAPQSLFDKIWSQHVVRETPDGNALLYIDRHYLQDGSPRAFDMIASHGLDVRRPDLTFGTIDHYMPSDSGRLDRIGDAHMRRTVDEFRANTQRHGIAIFDEHDAARGIMHVSAPEQGLSLPGTTIVCSDSHTPTHGALGALAFGIGSSESGHCLATQTIWMKRPRSMRIVIDGALGPFVTAKDVALALIARIGAGGAVGYVIEYAGPVVEAMSVEARLTLCNMAIESGARAALVAPDDTTFDWLDNRPFAPRDAQWHASVQRWRALRSDASAHFDQEWRFDCSTLSPVVTWGVSPEHTLPVDGRVPDPQNAPTLQQRRAWQDALDYMAIAPGTPLTSIPVDHVFIGSCTNGRIEDLRVVAQLVAHRRIVVPAWIVPGSNAVRDEAERSGIAQVLRDAGFEWRHSGCSLCVGQNGDRLAPGQRCVSTTNRNFKGRQGTGVRTHLASPASAAAAALTGRIADVRLLGPDGAAHG